MLTSQLPSINKDSFEFISDLPSEILSSPALLFLYYRIEQILGIKAAADSLNNLNQYLEKSCGSSFIENPAAYEFLLTSREQIYNISKLLTINETYFFREGIHFTLLTNLLPDLIKLGKPLQICCAAVSIGCEAYTIAMLLDYYIKKGFRFDYYIDAFDINLEAIETAKNARYNKNTFRADGVSWKHILDSYLIQDNNEFIVVKEIQNKVNFFPHNIMRGLEKQYDIIFFRNSLIYFS
ncbi:MAG: chemotaxis protein CheR, partial [Treponema sp.]|nr:chemotaxis protein CheR [Treponema sp.]